VSQSEPEKHNLTPQQAKELSQVLQQLRKTVDVASRVATLTVLAASYRDIHATMCSLHLRQAHAAPNPLTFKAPTSTAAQQEHKKQESVKGLSRFPIFDTTKLPDSAVPSDAHKLKQEYMDKITAWTQLQPNHMETSSQLLTGINLFPPQEAAYPTYVDFDAAVKELDLRRSTRKVRLLSRLKLKQDKYQIKMWGNSKGEI